jgi:hypothetical protein
MNAQDIRVFTIIPSYTEYNTTYAKVSDETDGQRYNINSNFASDLVSQLTGAILQKYTLRYCPLDKTTYNSERTVELALLADNSVIDSDTYTPLKDEVFIVRNTASQRFDREMKDQANDTVQLGVIVMDLYPDYPTSVKLYYRQLTNNGQFNEIEMNPNANTSYPQKEYLVIIPADSVINPGFEWYAIAFYADGTEVITPTSTEEFFAWTVAVFPNHPPLITLDNTSEVLQGQDLTVNYTVSDNTIDVEDITFYYRELNSPSVFTPYIVTPSGKTASYSNTIPASFMNGQGIEYYIKAVDNYGAVGFYGTASNPITIKFTDEVTIIDVVTPTSSYMNLQIDNARFECDLFQIGDILRVYYETNGGRTLVAAGEYTVTASTNLYSFSAFRVYGSDATPKNGFDVGETMRFILERNGVKSELFLNTPVVFNEDLYATTSVYGLSAGNLPKITVYNQNKSQVIVSGDMTPSIADNTYFGNVSMATTNTYVIQNSGCELLELEMPTITDDVNFSISSLGTYALQPYGEVQFTVTFNALVDAQSEVHIESNGKNADYNFMVEGDKLVEAFNMNAFVSPNPMPAWGGQLYYTIPSTQQVVVKLFNNSGTLLETIVDKTVYTGSTPVSQNDWVNMGTYPSGTYVLTITTSTGLNQSVTFTK